MASDKHRTFMVVGYGLIAFAFACLFAAAIIATLEGHGGIGLDYRATGRQAFFTPVIYLPLLAGLVLVVAAWSLRRLSRRPDKRQGEHDR